MHQADDILDVSCLCDANVAIATKRDFVAFSFDDSVDQIAASDVFYKHNGSLTYLLVCPGTKSYLITEVHDEWIHAIAFCTDGYGLAFGNQLADFLHHQRLIFDYCAHRLPKIIKICLYTDKNSYLWKIYEEYV